MTHDTGNIPPVPSDVPEAAKKPRSTAPDGGADRGTRETRAASAGATGTAGKAQPDNAPDARPRTKAPAAAPLNGDGMADAGDASESHALRPLFPEGDHDKLALRIQHAVSEFVESPRRAVEEAESTFDSVVEGLKDALEEHRRTLGTVGRDGDSGMRTEELRVTLQHYRDLTERLLNV
ncbi:hypothetical protein [Streptomyces sp. NBC_00385]|uniref:hypothetical protein n=1 Tax=Streptomyces sp. NBC_00385 TaxID=2975733 RepID=UPI002DDB8479|nr:hypothetical protein [Streptomyces sp. NBC_00385]WRZ08625.1 hypothetical protein OG959_37395 [Streptomyces sp. NBC_00385]